MESGHIITQKLQDFIKTYLRHVVGVTLNSENLNAKATRLYEPVKGRFII